MKPAREPDDELWSAFDAALRAVDRPGPDPSLREQCLPDGGRSAFGVRHSEGEPPDRRAVFGVRPSEEEPQNTEHRTPNTEHRTPNTEHRRVLVVDDEPNIRKLIEHHLVRAGYEVVQAVDGIEALAQVQEQRPDLIVLDVMMPGPDGFRVLDALKEDPRTAEIPVIMLTAKGQDDHVRRSLKGGAEFHMAKPFNPAELRLLVDRLAAVLGTPENPPPLRRWLK